MTKTEAIRLLGGTISSTASAVGVSAAAVCQWPEQLPARIADRVQAALWRQSQQVKIDSQSSMQDVTPKGVTPKVAPNSSGAA